jgi:hypothetical protein
MKLKNFINKARNFVKRSRGYKVFMHSSTKRRKGGAISIRRRPYKSSKQPSKIKKTSNFLYKHKGKILSLAAMALLANRGSKVNIDDMLPANWDDIFDPY